MFAPLLRTAAQRNWVVYAKRPFAGSAQVLTHLSGYTHRIAIANSHLISMADGGITFRWRDYAHGHPTRIMTLDANEFLRCLLLHVLPPGFVRIRYFGLLVNLSVGTDADSQGCADEGNPSWISGTPPESLSRCRSSRCRTILRQY